MQQHLPFTVLKRIWCATKLNWIAQLQQHLPFTVLKQFNPGAEPEKMLRLQQHLPFTVLKLVNAFQLKRPYYRCNSTYRLRYWNTTRNNTSIYLVRTELQQHLPFMVLKQVLLPGISQSAILTVATALTVYGIETHQ